MNQELTDILYKYRGLSNFKNFVDILLRNRLFAANYQNLNDPMEGHFYHRGGKMDRNTIERLQGEKERLRICSLSTTCNNELMWSHYAEGQRGVAIGLRVTDKDCVIKPIQYNGFMSLDAKDFNSKTAIEIMSRKYEVWSYEKEVRVFVQARHFVDVQVEEVITGRSMSNSDYGLVRDLVGKIDPNIRITKAASIMGL